MSAPTAAHHYHFDITMTCSGCSGAVERVLKRTEGLILPSILPSPPLFLSLYLARSLHVHFIRSLKPGIADAHSGLTSYTISLDSQTADVYTDNVDYETVLEKIKKTGKTVRGARRDGVEVGV